MHWQIVVAADVVLPRKIFYSDIGRTPFEDKFMLWFILKKFKEKEKSI